MQKPRRRSGWCLVFRLRLKDEAQSWYQRLEPTVRGNWTLLSNEFATEYRLEPRSAPDPNQFFNQLYNLKQGKNPISQYVQEAEDLFRKCPENLRTYIGTQFIAGIADEGKLDSGSPTFILPPSFAWRTR